MTVHPARGRYLGEVLKVLYPPPHRVWLGGDATGDATGYAAGRPPLAEYIAVPHRHSPRLAVPVRPRAGRLAAARSLPLGASLPRRLRALALRAALASDTGARLAFGTPVRVYGPAGAPSFASHLHEVLGRAVQLSVHVGGPHRASRKPVVAVYDAGTVVGFAKLGVDELTAELVRSETRVLRMLAKSELTSVRTPEVIYAGAWRGHEILLQSALPVWRPAVAGTASLVRAMCEIARMGGTARRRLGASDYWARLLVRLAGVGDRAAGRDLAAIAGRLVAGAEQTELEFGSWHGDWSPWNTHAVADAVLVWDWERCTSGVPVGFDALHYQLQGGLGQPAAVRSCLAQAQQRLAPFGVAPAVATLTAQLYLVDIAARYLTDGQDVGGPVGGAVGDWLLPELARSLPAGGDA